MDRISEKTYKVQETEQATLRGNAKQKTGKATSLLRYSEVSSVFVSTIRADLRLHSHKKVREGFPSYTFITTTIQNPALCWV